MCGWRFGTATEFACDTEEIFLLAFISELLEDPEEILSYYRKQLVIHEQIAVLKLAH